MNAKKSLALFTVAVLLSVASVALLLNRPEVALPPGRLLKVNFNNVEKVEIYRQDKLSAAFAKSQSGKYWKVRLPGLGVSDRADGATIEQLASLVVRSFARPVKVTQEEAGLADKAACIQLVINDKDKNAHTMWVGKLSSDGSKRYVAVGGDETVHAVKAMITKVLDRPAGEFRSLDLFDMRKGELARMVLKSGKVKLRLENSADGWVLTEPVRWPANPKIIDRMLRIFSRLRAITVVSNKPTDPTVFGITAQSPTITIRIKGKDQTVRFGKQVEGAQNSYAMVDGREPVYEIPDTLSRELTVLDPSPFRDKALGLLKDTIIASIDISLKDQGTLKLSIVDNKWVASGAREFQADVKAIQNLVKWINQLSAIEFASEDTKKKAEFGLDVPACKIVATDSGGKQVLGLNLSAVIPSGNAYVSIDGRPQILVIHPAVALYLQNQYIRYRTRNICSFDIREARELNIKSGGGEFIYKHNSGTHWQQSSPASFPVQDDNLKFMSMLRLMAKLDTLGFVEENAKDMAQYGLDKPRVSVITKLRQKDKKLKIVLKMHVGKVFVPNMGAKKGQKARKVAFARLEGTNDVFLLDEKLAQMLMHEYK